MTPEEPGAIAYLALLLVVPGSILAFSLMRVERAVMAVLLASLMFLPEKVAFDAALIPPLDKHSLPALCALIGVFLKGRDRVREAKLGRRMDWLIVLAVVANFGTVFTNPDVVPAIEGPRPALTPGDGVTLAIQFLLGPGAAFFLGRAICRSEEDADSLFRMLAIAGLVYAPFILVELRLSPQWHVWVYGYRQHSFLQAIRGDSYRPMVFMEHGLALAMFSWASGFAAWQLSRNEKTLFGLSALPFAVVLSVILVSLNSVAAAIYGLVTYPLAWLLRTKTLVRVALALGLLVVGYPILRGTGVFPADALVDFAARFSQERAQSLGFRFDNEALILERTLERPWFGWGGWGRGFVRNEWGYVVTIVDGAWIILLSITGAVGFVLRFGLLVLPIAKSLVRFDALPASGQPLLAAMCLLTAVPTMDLLPNGLFNQLPFLFAGATLGLTDGLEKSFGTRLDPARLLGALLLVRRIVGSRAALGGQVGTWERR